MLELWTLWTGRGLVHKSTACAWRLPQAPAATIDEAEDDRAEADVGGLAEADRLAGQRAVDLDKFATPFDFAGQAHPPHLDVVRIVGLAQNAVPAPRRGLVMVGVNHPFRWISEAVDLKKEKSFFKTRVIEDQNGGSLPWD
jgi:hypothetical protein